MQRSERLHGARAGGGNVEVKAGWHSPPALALRPLHGLQLGF